jgi:hypothetical protein
MGFIISKLDSYSNIDVIMEAIGTRTNWKQNLRLKIFKDDHVCKINCGNMRKKEKIFDAFLEII